MKKIVAAVVSAFALAGAAPSFAQTAAPTPAAAAIDPATLAASQELFEAMNHRAMMTGMMRQMTQGIAQSMRAGAEAGINNNPKLNAEQKTKALAKMEAELPGVIKTMQDVLNDPKLIDEILAETVPIYARTFSADELKQMTAFYRTPVGAKMLASMPQLMAQGMQVGQQVVSRRMGPVMQKMQQEGKQ